MLTHIVLGEERGMPSLHQAAFLWLQQVVKRLTEITWPNDALPQQESVNSAYSYSGCRFTLTKVTL